MEKQLATFRKKYLQKTKKSLKLKDSGPRLICVDGKEEKGTGRKYGTDEEIRNLQTLHVFDTSSEICLFSRTIDKKTNEIPVAQEVLKILQLKGCIVSFDALHTQKDTIKIIVEQKGDYVGALKGNQGILSTEAEASFTPEIKTKIKSDGENYYESSEKAHSQIETRRFYMVKAKHRFNGIVEWQNLRHFICYEKYICNIITAI